MFWDVLGGKQSSVSCCMFYLFIERCFIQTSSFCISQVRLPGVEPEQDRSLSLHSDGRPEPPGRSDVSAGAIFSVNSQKMHTLGWGVYQAEMCCCLLPSDYPLAFSPDQSASWTSTPQLPALNRIQQSNHRGAIKWVKVPCRVFRIF